MSTLQPPGSPLLASLEAQSGSVPWGPHCGGLGLSPQHQLPKSTGSPGGLDPPSLTSRRLLEDRGLAGPRSANISLILTWEAERWGADPRLPEQAAGTPGRLLSPRWILPHTWNLTAMWGRRSAATARGHRPSQLQPRARSPHPAPQALAPGPPCSSIPRHHLRRNCPQITDLCFCTKTSCWASPDTPADIPVPLLKAIWAPNQKEVD